ncbi:MAG: flagellar basal body P-ring formation chaperone FlgA [Pseudomonadota bacterium]
MLRFALAFLIIAPPAIAETLVAARTVRPQTILAAADLAVIERTIPGMLTDHAQAVGQETRVALYAGRPIRPEDIGAPAVIDRNQIVTLIFSRGGLTIATDARALDRAGIGDMLRVMNLSSRSTVSGIVRPDGTVRVGGHDLSQIN